MKKQEFLKKRFHLLKKHLYQKGEAQNMPVLASSYYSFQDHNEFSAFSHYVFSRHIKLKHASATCSLCQAEAGTRKHQNVPSRKIFSTVRQKTFDRKMLYPNMHTLLDTTNFQKHRRVSFLNFWVPWDKTFLRKNQETLVLQNSSITETFRNIKREPSRFFSGRENIFDIFLWHPIF